MKSVTEDPNFDMVEAANDLRLDVVERIYGRGHHRQCDYRPYVNSLGLVYCLTCEQQVSSLTPMTEPHTGRGW